MCLGVGSPVTVHRMVISEPSAIVRSCGPLPLTSSAGIPVTRSVPVSVAMSLPALATQVYTPVIKSKIIF